MTETDKAYLAGIIDGEGCIGLYRDNKTFKLKLSIVSTSIDWLRNLRNRWDELGYFLIAHTSQRKPHWKLQSHRVTYNSNAQYILREVLPYLSIKREQAELALTFKPNEVKRDEQTGRFTVKGEDMYESHFQMAASLKAMKKADIPMPDGTGRL